MNTFNCRILSFSLALAAMLGLAASAMAEAPKGAGMMTPEKQEIIRKLHEDFHNSTQAIRQELISKRHELDAQLYSTKPDENRIRALTKEISDLRAKLYSARITMKGKLIQEGVMLERGGYCPGMGRGAGHYDGKGKGPGRRHDMRGSMEGCCVPR